MSALQIALTVVAWIVAGAVGALVGWLARGKRRDSLAVTAVEPSEEAGAALDAWRARLDAD